MEIVQTADVAAWRADAEVFLRAREATHGLMLGVARATPTARLALTVRERGRVIGAALATTDRVLLSEGPPEAFAALAGVALSGSGGAVGAPESVHALLTAGGVSATIGREGIYATHEAPEVPDVPGACRAATLADLPTLTPLLRAFSAEALPGDPPMTLEAAEAHLRARIANGTFFVWEVEGAVQAHAGLAGPTREVGGGVRVNAVYTRPEARGCGYAGALTAAITRRALRSGRAFVFLYTDLTNAISNRVYRRVGYIWVAASHHARMTPAHI